MVSTGTPGARRMVVTSSDVGMRAPTVSVMVAGGCPIAASAPYVPPLIFTVRARAAGQPRLLDRADVVVGEHVAEPVDHLGVDIQAEQRRDARPGRLRADV